MTDKELARESWWNNNNNCSGALPTEQIYECGFLAGLKLGRPKWHKVADGDLPDDDRYVWTNEGPSYYDNECLCWRCEFGRRFNVLAWCEPKFEEVDK